MKRIAAERILSSISQQELANKLGVVKQTVYRWENGITNPSIADLFAMANLFGCTVDWLLGRTENRK